MFFHLYKTRIKCLLKDKSLFFWSLCYPIILGTLFFVGFGDGTNLKENFSTIPVALVIEDETNDYFKQVIEQVSNENGTKLFQVTVTVAEEATRLLDEKQVDGIIFSGNELKLTVKNSGMNQSILKSFLDQYQQRLKIIGKISTTNPDSLTMVFSNEGNSKPMLKEVTLGGSSMNSMIQYYYALMAMTCLLGSYYGLKNATQTQANASPMGARRSVTPTHKLSIVVAEIFAAITLHFTEILLVFMYLRFVLGIQIGNQPELFMLCCFIGCLIGICLGQFLGAVTKGSYVLKTTILTVVTTSLSFLGGLMIANMKDIIEKNIPIINRFNPTALLTDAFYCLTVYDDYSRFTRNLITLTAMAVILSIASFFVTRREKYASI